MKSVLKETGEATRKAIRLRVLFSRLTLEAALPYRRLRTLEEFDNRGRGTETDNESRSMDTGQPCLDPTGYYHANWR